MIYSGMPEEKNNIYASSSFKFIQVTLSRVVSYMGFGLAGLRCFTYDASHPLYFYLISVGIAFIVHFVSLNVIKLSSYSVVGVSATFGPIIACTTVLSIVTALVTLMGISLKYSIIKLVTVLFKDLNVDNVITMLILIFGAVLYAIIRFKVPRRMLYVWSKLLFGLCLLLLLRINVYYDPKPVRRFLFYTRNSVPLRFDENNLIEFLTIQGIVLGALFMERICDRNSLKYTNREDDKTYNLSSETKDSHSMKDFVSLIISDSLGFLIFCLVVSIHFASFPEIDSKTTKYLWAVIIMASFIQSLEFFDSAYNLFSEHFKDFFKESAPSMENEVVRELALILPGLSITYYVRNLNNIYLSIVYSNSLWLSLPFITIPAVALIKKYRDRTILSNSIVIPFCVLMGVTGVGLLISVLFGYIIQRLRSFGQYLMFDSMYQLGIAAVLSLLIYFLFMFLDRLIYADGEEYTDCYITEIIIGAFALGTIFSKTLLRFNFYRVNIISEIRIVLFHNLRTFMHNGLPHFLVNSLTFYPLGKRLAKTIGPFYLLAFIMISGMFSSILSQILEIHVYNDRIDSIGASGFIASLLGFVKYDKFGRITGFELLIYYIILSICLLPFAGGMNICHSGHLGGLIVGLLLTDLWKYKRNEVIE